MCYGAMVPFPPAPYFHSKEVTTPSTICACACMTSQTWSWRPFMYTHMQQQGAPVNDIEARASISECKDKFIDFELKHRSPLPRQCTITDLTCCMDLCTACQRLSGSHTPYALASCALQGLCVCAVTKPVGPHMRPCTSCYQEIPP